MKSLERILKQFLGATLRLVLPRWRGNLPDPSDVTRILVIRQHNQLGDMLCAVPLLRALRTNYPSAHVALMASTVNLDVMRHNKYLDSLIHFDKTLFVGERGFRPQAFLSFLRVMRKQRFDIVLVPMTVSMSFTSCLLAFLSGGRIRAGAEEIDGMKNVGAAFLNLPVTLDWRNEPHRHQTLRNLDTARHLSVQPPSDFGSEISLTAEEVHIGGLFVRAEMREKKCVIAFHPGAGKVPNRWPADRFADVANTLSEQHGALVIVTSGPMDDLPVAGMVEGLRGHPVVVRGLPIRQVAAILSHAQLVVSNDTGIMHVAAAVGVPVLSLFGPTDPAQWAPIGPKHRFLHEGDDIRQISVDRVLETANEML